MYLKVTLEVKRGNRFERKTFTVPNSKWIVYDEMPLIYHYDENLRKFVAANYGGDVDWASLGFEKEMRPADLIIAEMKKDGIEAREDDSKTVEGGLES